MAGSGDPALQPAEFSRLPPGTLAKLALDFEGFAPGVVLYQRKFPFMKHHSFSLVWAALWLVGPAGAQVARIPAERQTLNIIQTEEPAFPLTLSNTKVMQGDAMIAIDIDQNGNLADWLVTGYSRKEFAESALAAIKHWRFEPPRLNGEPWASVQELHLDFTRTGVVVNSTAFEALNSILDELIKANYVYRTYTLRELDRIPTPLKVVSPRVPALGANEKTHTVSVEFYIDEQGHVRLPSVGRGQAGDVFAALALDAVKQWLFEPPTVNGRPVLVLARQDFNFVPKL
jgi:TonB family protein